MASSFAAEQETGEPLPGLESPSRVDVRAGLRRREARSELHANGGDERLEVDEILHLRVRVEVGLELGDEGGTIHRRKYSGARAQSVGPAVTEPQLELYDVATPTLRCSDCFLP
jgi:hypothetical protein